MEVRKYYLTYIYEKAGRRCELLYVRRFSDFNAAWKYGVGSGKAFNVGVEVVLCEN